ncbi:ATP-binding cassette domain-containing protein [Streptomyces violascens]|uniref:ATP-binding cassette domain-containing protein n=1 Tax=Streptomyces violascens TaxID=67381 RepID=UPI0036512529
MVRDRGRSGRSVLPAALFTVGGWVLRVVGLGCAVVGFARWKSASQPGLAYAHPAWWQTYLVFPLLLAGGGLLFLLGQQSGVQGRRRHALGRVDMRHLRTYIGHVDPRHALRSPLRVRDVVLTGLTNTSEWVPRWTPTAEQAARAEELIALLGLGERREARWPTLSQGERGRALIARALMPRPRLLLLDEPATGLDVAGREQLIERVDALQLADQELSSVLVTHHLEELPPGTTHVLLLREGRALASGPAQDVLTSDRVSACFAHPIHLTRTDGRWNVRAGRRPPRERVG